MDRLVRVIFVKSFPLELNFPFDARSSLSLSRALQAPLAPPGVLLHFEMELDYSQRNRTPRQPQLKSFFFASDNAFRLVALCLPSSGRGHGFEFHHLQLYLDAQAMAFEQLFYCQ